MRKLGAGDTVRIFVPVPVEMRDQFEASCNGDTMAGVLRDMIAERIAKKRLIRTPIMVQKPQKETAE